NDILEYNVLGDYQGDIKSLYVRLGTGNDRFTFNTNGWDIKGTDWVMDIVDSDGPGGGADTVTLNFGDLSGLLTDIANSAVSVSADLGAGADKAAVNFNGNIGDAVGTYPDTRVDLSFLMGSENDQFLGQLDLDNLEIFGDGKLDLEVYGGLGNDTIKV